MNSLLQSYDEVPYPSLCYTQTHPDRLATIATLLGMDPAPVDDCRVLELGCASGGNVIPMAHALPQSRFVGLDFSARQIAAGREAASALGLENVTLRQMDIMEVTPELGEFDYIIAHGIYSWVPAPVREKMLQICGQQLAPQGVAYISFNAYPGWHMLGALREMMLYHVRAVEDPGARVQAARRLLHFLAGAMPDEAETRSSFMGAYGVLLNAYLRFVEEQRRQARAGDELLLHDELEEINQPFYFYEFMEAAGQHGLQYLAETEFPQVMPSEFPLEVKQELLRMARDVVALEQYMDFLRNRTLRQTLLCHEGVAVQRVVRPEVERMAQFRVASRARPLQEELDVRGEAVGRFGSGDGPTFASNHPVTKAAMLTLAQVSPRAMPFAELLAAAQARVYGEDLPAAEQREEDALVLTANLLQAFSHSLELVELHVHQAPFVVHVSERPVASELARFQAEQGALVVNRRHERVTLDESGRTLLPYLDGSRGPEDLLALVSQLYVEGKIRLEVDGEPVRNLEEARPHLLEELRLVLGWMARAALLVG